MNTTAPFPSSSGRILVVDDDAPIREALYEALTEWSFEPCLAANFRAARTAVLTEAPFSVIVSDYHLPDGDGLGFLDWLRREMLIPVPFLLISGGIARAPAAATNFSFLAKPFQLEELRRQLDVLSRATPELAPILDHSAAQEAMASVYARLVPSPAKSK